MRVISGIVYCYYSSYYSTTSRTVVCRPYSQCYNKNNNHAYRMDTPIGGAAATNFLFRLGCGGSGSKPDLFTPAHIADVGNFFVIRLLLAHLVKLCQRIPDSSSSLHCYSVCLVVTLSDTLSIPRNVLSFNCGLYDRCDSRRYKCSEILCVLF